MKKKFKKNSCYIITLISALIVVVTVYIIKDVAPFGKNSLLTIDFFHQYGPMLGELYNRIHHFKTLIYSFTMGNGLPFFRNFFNYLSSPLNILMLFFRHRDLIMSYSVIIGLKTVLAALTMLFYLNNKFKKDYKFIPLAIFYAFNAYFVAYYWNIMWLDGMYMIPLVALGIEWLIDKDKPMLYIVSLVVMLFTNYFIGFMMCIFSVIYFVAYLIITTKKHDKKKIIKKCGKFITSSILAGGLSACFLIPLFMALRGISATGDLMPISQYYDFSLVEFIFNHLSGVTSTVLKSDLKNAPNISCGIVSLALLFAFCVNKKIPLKTKLCYTGILLFLIISFFFGPLDYLWHAMHVPNDLPFRYSFIYCFILIVISGYAINKIKYLESKKVVIIYIVCLILLSIAKIFKVTDFDDYKFITNTAIITIVYLLYVFYNANKKISKYLFVIFLAVAITDSILCINHNWEVDQFIESFYNNYDEINEIRKSIDDNDSDKFYRIGETSVLTFNDSSWYGYYGNVSFSSMEYESMAKLMRNLGIPGNDINSYYYKNTTPIYDMMFDIKYVMGNINDDSIYTPYYENADIIIYQNKYNLGLMYGVDPTIVNYSGVTNPFVNQDNYIYYATGIEDVLEQIDDIQAEPVYFGDDGRLITKYRIRSNGNNTYLHFDDYGVDFFVLDNVLYYYSNDSLDNYDYSEFDQYVRNDYGEKYVINYKNDNEYFDLYIGYYDDYGSLFSAYQLNKDKFQRAYDYLNNYRVNITKFNEKKIIGKVNFDSDRIVYTSISYDPGWHVYVDGKQVKTMKIVDSLLGFEVPSGKHTIKLRYRIPYLGIGLCISILSLFGIVCLKKGWRWLKWI